MDLYLLRHGDATQPNWYANDATRPLTKQGNKEAQQAATALQRLGVEPDRIIASPYVRALQTAETVAQLLLPTQAVEQSEAIVPAGPFTDLLDSFTPEQEHETILIVSHMPTVGELAGWLIWGNPQTTLPFRTGGLCRITIAAPPRPGSGTLRWLAPPKLLRLLQA